MNPMYYVHFLYESIDHDTPRDESNEGGKLMKYIYAADEDFRRSIFKIYFITEPGLRDVLKCNF